MTAIYPADVAAAITAIRRILNEPTAQFWTDQEITDWIAEACVRVSAAMLCYEVQDYITLATGKYEYASAGASGVVADLIKVEACVFASAVTSSTYAYGMARIHPRMLSHVMDATAATSILTARPKYWWHFGQKIGVWPVPTASVNAKQVQVFGYKQTETFLNIPEALQPIVIDMAAARAFLKDRKYSVAAQYNAQATALMNFHRRDLYQIPSDSKDMLMPADRSVPVQSQG